MGSRGDVTIEPDQWELRLTGRIVFSSYRQLVDWAEANDQLVEKAIDAGSGNMVSEVESACGRPFTRTAVVRLVEKMR